MNKIADDSKLPTSLVNKTATEGFDVNTFENMLHDVYEEDSVDSEDFNSMSIVKKKKRSINMSEFGELSDNSDDSSDDSNDHEDAKRIATQMINHHVAGPLIQEHMDSQC